MVYKKFIIFICFVAGFSQNTNADDSKITSVTNCPGVIICRNNDNSKQAATAYEENQKTYQCYSKFGDTQMRDIAAKAMTECQVINSSINPVIRNN
ncbi:MAG: hypothetical protein K0R49_599 [Burkholderiales bacterium]|jgi:hypothetical protein|nr:hypothetical protein [Burkholderiales bacterium]